MRGSSHIARKNAPTRADTEVVTSAKRSAKPTLKMHSVVMTKMAVMPSEARSRLSRVSIRSKFSSVNELTDSVRPMSVKATPTSTMTGAIKKSSSRIAVGPRNRAKLARRRRICAVAKLVKMPPAGTARVMCFPGRRSRTDHDFLAQLIRKLLHDEIGRRLRRQSTGLNTLNALVQDRVVLADLRMTRHEARVFQHRRGCHERPPLVDHLRHRLGAVGPRHLIGRDASPHGGKRLAG